MKKLIVLLALISTNAFAQLDFEMEEVVFTDLLSVHKLTCVTTLGRTDVPAEERTFTQLERAIFPSRHEAIEMDHRAATVMGCDLEALDQLVHDSHMRFGHAEAVITVRRGLSKKPRMVFGKCQRNYQEEVKIDFGQGTILKTSRLGKLKPATGCQ